MLDLGWEQAGAGGKVIFREAKRTSKK